jgi:hypothetical protein
MIETDDLLRFERRFRAIEAEIPDRPFEVRGHRAHLRARDVMPVLAVGTLIVLVVAFVIGSPTRRPADTSTVGEPSATATVTPEPSPSPRTITTGEITWTAVCNATSDTDCDGAVGLFANNLAWSRNAIFDASSGRVTVEPRACPTFNGLTARQCWDVTAVRPDEPFCMVVAYDASDPRYAGYFQLGGHDGSGRIGPPPSGLPMCIGEQ